MNKLNKQYFRKKPVVVEAYQWNGTIESAYEIIKITEKVAFK